MVHTPARGGCRCRPAFLPTRASDLEDGQGRSAARARLLRGGPPHPARVQAQRRPALLFGLGGSSVCAGAAPLLADADGLGGNQPGEVQLRMCASVCMCALGTWDG